MMEKTINNSTTTEVEEVKMINDTFTDLVKQMTNIGMGRELPVRILATISVGDVEINITTSNAAAKRYKWWCQKWWSYRRSIIKPITVGNTYSEQHKDGREIFRMKISQAYKEDCQYFFNKYACDDNWVVPNAEG